MRQPCPSDLAGERRATIEPPVPVPHVGRPRTDDMREVPNAILYLVRSGCRWDMPPHGPPAGSTVHRHFARWRDDGTWQRIMDAPRQEVRVAAGREPGPGAGSIDSRTVEGAEVGGERGYDGGKRLGGRERHIIADGLGWLLVVVAPAASADDGTFAPEVLRRPTPERRGRLGLARADGKSNNRRLDRWLARAGVGPRVEVVGRPPGSAGFVGLPRRRAVERTFAWIGRCRRDGRDYGWHARTGESMIRVSSVHRMLRLLRPDGSREPIPFKCRESQGKIMG